MPLPIWRPEEAAYLQCDGPELRASTKPGFRTGLACLPLESSCRLPADADRRASKTQFLKNERESSPSDRFSVATRSLLWLLRRSSALKLTPGLAWIMSELPPRALRISSTFERSAADVRPADRPSSGCLDVQNPGHMPTKASNKTSNTTSNTKISCSFKLLI
jgi:hypothetical protein